MRWKQFLTPVKSIDADQARQFIQEQSPADMTILDVRQPGEYADSHLAGAKLIPLPDLPNRLDEVEKDKPVVVY
jgi:rhodanese-related sulfurtransferase